MTRVAWPQLMRLGMVDLGLAPRVFWDLTPAELLVLAGGSVTAARLDRSGLNELMSRYPDAKRPVG